MSFIHKLDALALVVLLHAAAIADAADPQPPPTDCRIVFLGDSITHGGQYIDYIDALLRLQNPAAKRELLNLGLPSETLSGLSEPGHAGGQFPRPDLHERLDRILEQAKPNLVVACYGMNDGIYYPPSEERLAKYQDGIRFLRARAAATHAGVLHVTPPVFDPVPIQGKTLPAGLAEYPQPYEGYDEVLDQFSRWLVSQRAQGWDVVDAHGPMKEFLASERRKDPNFRLAGDGVHIDATGHWIIAQQILLAWGALSKEAAQATSGQQAVAAYAHGQEVLKLVAERQRVLRDAWLTATGHKRPGMKTGLPLDKAERRAGELNAAIDRLLKPTE
ncbi:MAG TPA: SGNH/GDSL hydrolase family protein [Pirellulales bacterium]|jgi:lysophospholipase L1-like esterase|nr:SGNH/GDSL hydrolase family protein [Pirellulales bacterium]